MTQLDFEIYRDYILGQGGFSTVFGTDDCSAAKVISKTSLLRAETQKALFNEISYHRLFDHPNIPQLYGVYELPDEIVLKMELVEGQSLVNLISTQQFPETRVQSIIEQILSALSHVHSHSLIHNDIKCSNVMVTDNDRVKLLDFGLCYRQGSAQQSKSGTPGFLAPEFFTDAKATFKRDSFAVGVLMYILMTKHFPYEIEGDIQ
jgi:serine/threonine protein kinase